MLSPYSDGEFYKTNTLFNPFVKKTIKTRIPIIGTVIDFGCGIGTNIYNLKEMGWDVYGVEREPIAVEKAKKTIGCDRIFAKDINELDFDVLPCFDLALCNYVLQHINKDDVYKFFDKLFNKAKKESYFIISFFDDRDGITFSEITEYLTEHYWALERFKRWERLDTSHGSPHLHKGIESLWAFKSNITYISHQ